MNVISVKGQGKAVSEPDLVTLSFNVEAKSMEYGQCVNKLNSKTEELRNNITNSGLERQNLKTKSFNIQSVQKYVEKEYVFDGYSASHTLSIQLPMVKELLNLVLQKIAEGHSGTEINLRFSVKDEEGFRRKVLADAVRDAKLNAETLASAAGVVLGKLQKIDSSWSEVRIYDMETEFLCQNTVRETNYLADIEAADVKAQDSVSLVYELVE